MTKLNNKDNFRFPLPNNFLISSVTGYYVTAQDLEMFDNYVKTFKDILEIIQSILSVFPKKKEKVNFNESKLFTLMNSLLWSFLFFNINLLLTINNPDIHPSDTTVGLFCYMDQLLNSKYLAKPFVFLNLMLCLHTCNCFPIFRLRSPFSW